MATIQVVLVDGTTAYASDVMDDFYEIYSNITNVNIASGAGIVYSKLDSATVMGVANIQTITGAKTFSALVTATAGLTITGDCTFGTNILVIDDTNNRIYEGATATTTIDSLNYQHQITVLGSGTPALALISTATGSTGVREARYHNSSSPADNDLIYTLKVYGNNDASSIKEYGRITVSAEDVTAGTEDAQLYIDVMKAGTLTTTLMVDRDQVQVRPESLVVGGSTNVGPDGFNVGLYTILSDSNRRVACFSSTDATANPAVFDIYKNSASPAASDLVAVIRFMGNDSASNYQMYSEIVSRITDPTSGSEDSSLELSIVSSGSTVDPILMASTAGAVEITVTGQLTVVGNTNSITSTDTTGDAVTITASSLTTGSALVVSSNSSSTSTRNLVEIINDNASANNTTCLYIQQDGSGNCVRLVSSNNSDSALYVDYEGAGGYSAHFLRTSSSAGDVATIRISGPNSGAGDAIGISFDSDIDALFSCGVASAGVISTSTTNSTGSFYMYDLGGTRRKVPYF